MQMPSVHISDCEITLETEGVRLGKPVEFCELARTEATFDNLDWLVGILRSLDHMVSQANTLVSEDENTVLSAANSRRSIHRWSRYLKLSLPLDRLHDHTRRKTKTYCSLRTLHSFIWTSVLRN